MYESLAFTKRKSQAFACLDVSKQTTKMKVSDIRRERLRDWFAGKPFPEREKSYISQLLSGTASFGEKAARRLERDYGMPDGYLDIPNKNVIEQQRKLYDSQKSDLESISAEETEILMSYRKKSRAEQLMVLKILDIKTPDFVKSA